jgi:hypothetical protein
MNEWQPETMITLTQMEKNDIDIEQESDIETKIIE